MIATSAGPRHYMDMLNWIAPATLTGCPATVAPVGRTPQGLPVGIQIMGPYWEDARQHHVCRSAGAGSRRIYVAAGILGIGKTVIATQKK